MIGSRHVGQTGGASEAAGGLLMVQSRVGGWGSGQGCVKLGQGDGAGAGWGEAQQGEGSGEHGQCPEGVAVAGGALQGSLPDPTRARSTILAALNSGCWSFARLYKLGLGTPPVLSPVALCRFLVLPPFCFFWGATTVRDLLEK